MLGHDHSFLHMDELTKCASGTQSTRQHQTLRKWQLCPSPKRKSIWGNSLVEDVLVLKFRPLDTIISPKLPLFLQSTPHPFPLPQQEKLKKLTASSFPAYLKCWWLLLLLRLQKFCCACLWQDKWTGQVGWRTPAVWNQPLCPWHFLLRTLQKPERVKAQGSNISNKDANKQIKEKSKRQSKHLN